MRIVIDDRARNVTQYLFVLSYEQIKMLLLCKKATLGYRLKSLASLAGYDSHLAGSILFKTTATA